MPTFADLKTAVQDYTTYEDPDFLTNIPAFIRAAEERIWYFVQLPNFRRNVTGTFTAGNQYLNLPTGFLAPASLAITDASGAFVYLINKDVNYMREVYPDPSVEGEPTHYALFDADENNTAIIVAPTPDIAYATELHYFYRPTSLTDGADTDTTWLSVNAYDTLLMGTLSEASLYLKKNAGIDDMGAKYEERFVVAMQGLKNLGEARDRKYVYRSGEKRKAE